VKVYAENIYPHRIPEVSLLEVNVPFDSLLAIAPLLFSDSCLSTVHIEMAVADTEVFNRGDTLWPVDKSPGDSTHCYTYWNHFFVAVI
jgi:hypothetical protein